MAHSTERKTFCFISFAEAIDEEKHLWSCLEAMEAMEMDTIDCYTDSELEQFGHDVSDSFKYKYIVIRRRRTLTSWDWILSIWLLRVPIEQ